MSATATADRKVLQRVMQDQEALYHAADQILWEVDPDAALTSREREILRQVGIDDEHTIQKERARVQRVKRLMCRAGTHDDFVAAEKAAIAAAREDASKRPELEEKLANLQAEIDGLARARAEAGVRLASVQQARESLRQLSVLPGFIRKAYQADRHAIDMRHEPGINEVKQALSLTEQLAKIDLNSRDGTIQAVLHCQAAYPEAIRRHHGANHLDEVSWRKYVQQRLREREDLEDQLERLQRAHKQEIHELDDQLDFYVRRLEPQRSEQAVLPAATKKR